MSVATFDAVRSTPASRFDSPGVGYALREQNRYVLNDPAISAVEITFERADDPLRVDRYLGEQQFEQVSIHALKLSVASPDAPGRNYLDALLAIVQMPAGVPVGTLAIGKAGATNAGLLAASILGNKYPAIRDAVKAFRRQQTDTILTNPDPRSS